MQTVRRFFARRKLRRLAYKLSLIAMEKTIEDVRDAA